MFSSTKTCVEHISRTFASPVAPSRRIGHNTGITLADVAPSMGPLLVLIQTAEEPNGVQRVLVSCSPNKISGTWPRSATRRSTVLAQRLPFALVQLLLSTRTSVLRPTSHMPARQPLSPYLAEHRPFSTSNARLALPLLSPVPPLSHGRTSSPQLSVFSSGISHRQGIRSIRRKITRSTYPPLCAFIPSP